MRRRAWFALALALPLLTSCDLVGVRGSGEMITESREVDGFTEVELQGSGSVTVEVTGTESLTIQAEDNLMPLLTSEVDEGRLVLGTTEPISPTREIVYTVSVADLDSISVGGSGELSLSSVESPFFEITVSGSGSVSLQDLTADELMVIMSGSGEVELAGLVDHLDLDLSGSGDYLGERLTTTTAVVEVSGSGNAIVQVTEHLEAIVSGSGDIGYLGDPTVDSSVSGSGEIEPR
ncbi:MAG: head GIN domain-containing protein [Acidimicrobiia bacterium]